MSDNAIDTDKLAANLIIKQTVANINCKTNQPKDFNCLIGDITEILVKSTYHTAFIQNQPNLTAETLNNYEYEAVKYYQHNPGFHALIDHQVMHIVNRVKDYYER